MPTPYELTAVDRNHKAHLEQRMGRTFTDAEYLDTCKLIANLSKLDPPTTVPPHLESLMHGASCILEEAKRQVLEVDRGQ